jgi:serine/threonine protein kinase
VAPPDQKLLPGRMLGRYQLVARIARGGMGEVWLATAGGTGGFSKRVVIKTVLPDRAHDPSFIEMLAREAKLSAELSHPNLIEVFDFFEVGGIYAIAMEYVVGRSLSQIVRAARAARVAIPAWAALRVIWECCRGLEVAHANNIIHCDLSPGNVMLAFSGVTKVLDFGVASTADLRADRLKGKYHYMAPERVVSVIHDRRTDIYALGVIMYVLFTGQLPVTAPTDEALLWAIVHTPPRPPSAHVSIDPEIEQVILRAIDHDPDRRFQDAPSLLRAISRCREGQPGACSQLDMAVFLGSLFPDAPDLPAHVRATLSSRPDSVDAEQTQRNLSLLAYNSAELDELEINAVDSVEIQLDDAVDAELIPEPSSAAAPTPPAGLSTEPVRQLFEVPPSRAPQPGVFGAATPSEVVAVRGLFPDDEPLAEGTQPPDEARSLSGLFGGAPAAEPAPASSTRGVFGDLDRDDLAWPWARNVVKPT